MNFNKTSKGEQKVINLLRRGGIKFEREVTFQDLNGNSGVPLRFDFGIYQNKKLVALIEIDGIQHYQYTPYFHKTIMGFKKQKEWDRRKNKYCLMHNIPLIRIPYWTIEDLTLKDILTNPTYRVKSKYHNDDLISSGVRK